MCVEEKMSLENKITAILVSYNSEDLLANTLLSLRRHYPEVPLIIVDGSAPDNSCRKFLETMKDSFITKVFADHNIGHGRGMCLGLERCFTPFALLLDSDVTVHEPILEGMLEMMEPDTFGVGCLHNIGLDGHIFGIHEGHRSQQPIPYLHPFFALINLENYRHYHPFVHHGAPCYKTMIDIYNRGLSKKILKQFPGLHHSGGELNGGNGPGPVEHRMKGTRKIIVEESQGRMDILGGWQ
jgi:glycosyltransferase involved in cell wall biosynthesis